MPDLKHIPELDGLRGCAALSVFAVHLFMPVAGSGPPPASLPWRIVTGIAGWGTYGVDVFFVLSGFLITSLLLADRQNIFLLHNFYWKRVLRILPVYALYLTATWFLVPGSHGYVLLAVFFVANFDYTLHFGGPAWTLSIEEQFYLLWPQLVRRLAIRHIYTAAIVTLLASAGIRTAMLLFAGHAILQSTWYRCDGLAMGSLLACQWMSGETPMGAPARRFLFVLNSRWLLLVAIFYEFSCLSLHPPTRVSSFLLLTTNLLVYRFIRNLLAPSHTLTNLLGNLLRSTPLIFLGTISYGMYMYHGIWFLLFDRYFSSSSFSYSRFFVRAAVVMSATLITCLASLRWMERPIQGLRRYVLR